PLGGVFYARTATPARITTSPCLIYPPQSSSFMQSDGLGWPQTGCLAKMKVTTINIFASFCLTY
ncbi:hypothetical protein, partial [Aeromonas jandaei]|uniref:hypothetical protein n=1 Tax=Aeromonas jandaei TaxID=650 RepID=UPI00366F3999